MHTNYWLVALALLLIWLLLQLSGKMPAVHSWHQFLESFNSRGGNILILGGLSMFFFVQSMRLFYQVIDMAKAGVIKQDNAFILMALQFTTSSAFGGAFGAMLKTMTSDSGVSRKTDGAVPPLIPPAPATNINATVTVTKEV